MPCRSAGGGIGGADGGQAFAHRLGQPLLTDRGHLREEPLAVGEVAVCRVVRHARKARDLAEDYTVRPLGAGQLGRGLDERRTEVAVVMRGPDSG